jgi:2-dehydropantoate 2-reductase
MRVAVIGAGGVGGYYGGMLARSGVDVTFIARGTQLEAIRSNGLTVKTTHVGEFTVPVQATSDPNAVGPVELVLVCVKTYDTDTAVQMLTPLIHADTIVMSLQNGVEKEERIGRVVGNEHVLGALTYVSSRVESPGVIHQSWVQKLAFGELNEQASARTQHLLRLFERAEIAAEVAPDIRVAMWGKLLSVSAFAAVCCVTRLPAGIILRCPETTALLWGAIAEGDAVARVNGVAMPEDFVQQMQSRAATLAPTTRASMYYDLEAGRRLELDDVVGSVVRLGEKYGVATPLCFAMYAALKPFEHGMPDVPRT